GCRVKTRWHEHGDAFRPPERGPERGRILDRGVRDFTATICPRSTFISVPHDSPDLLICGEKGMSHDPSDLAGNSHDSIRSYSFPSSALCLRLRLIVKPSRVVHG